MSTVVLGVRRVATSSAVLLGENVLRLVVTAAVSFFIAGRLGPALFGILNFASALMAIFLGLAALGLDIPLTLRLTRTAGNPNDSAVLLGTAIALRLVAAIGVFVLLVGFAFVLRRADALALGVTVIVALSIFGYAPSVFDFWFKAEVRAGPPASMRLATTLFVSAAKIGCLWLGLGVIALAWTVVLEAVLGSALLWLAWRRANPTLPLAPWRPDPSLFRVLPRESWPYLASTAATLIMMKSDVVLLGALSSNSDAGIYSLVQKLSEVLYIVPVVLVDSAYPALVRRQGTSEANVDGQLLFDLASGAAFVAAAVGILLAGPAIELVFGSRYAASLPLFHWHAWTVVAIGLSVARSRWLGIAGLQRHAPLVAVVGAVINVVLNLAMIPTFGAWGAAGSALIAYFVAGFLTSFMIAELRPVGRMQVRALWPWGRLVERCMQSRVAAP